MTMTPKPSEPSQAIQYRSGESTGPTSIAPARLTVAPIAGAATAAAPVNPIVVDSLSNVIG